MNLRGQIRTAVLGFGNPVRSDDGVGCYVVDQLKCQVADSSAITILDMGTSAFEVLFQLQGHERILLIDAVVHSGEPDGTLYKLPASEVKTAIQDDPLVFLHSLKWDQALSYAKKILGHQYPEDIAVYLIAVSNTKLDIGLSPTVQAAGDKVVHLLMEDLKSASAVPV